MRLRDRLQKPAPQRESIASSLPYSATAATATVGATMLVMLFVSLWTVIEGDAIATAEGAGTPSISLSGEGNQRLDRTHPSAS